LNSKKERYEVDHHELLMKFSGAVEALEAKLKSVTPEQARFIPNIPDAWSISDHVIHIVDSDINNFIRCKSILAQPSSIGFVIDEEKWTRNIMDKGEDYKMYLKVFRLLRQILATLLLKEPESAWTKNYFQRTYQGKTENITLEKCIEIYANHIYFHIEYIDRNIDEYLKLKR
jgi:hypothetical protein